MVVDDSLTVRHGYPTSAKFVKAIKVVLAKDGIDALEQLQSITPRCPCWWIQMPRMDGFRLTRNVRSDSRTTHIPYHHDYLNARGYKHRNHADGIGCQRILGPFHEDDFVGCD